MNWRKRPLRAYRLLLLAVVGWHVLHVDGGQSGQVESPEQIAALVKPGMTASETDAVVSRHRSADRLGWDDERLEDAGRRSDRYQLPNGANLLVEFRAQLSGETVTDRVESVRVTRFDDLKQEVPASLMAALKLIQQSPSLNGFAFDPAALIRSVNGLHAEGSKQTLAAMDLYAKLAEPTRENQSRRLEFDLDANRILLVARLLFERKDGNPEMPETLGMGVGESPLTPDAAVATEWPLWPLALEADIPLLLSPGAVGGGIETTDDDVQYLERRCRMRTKPLAPVVSPLRAAEDVISSARWRDFFRRRPHGDEELTQRLIRVQAMRSVKPIAGDGFLVDHGPWDVPRWQAYLADSRLRDARWDAQKSEFLDRPSSTQP